MQIKKSSEADIVIVETDGTEIVISDVQSALDLGMDAKYNCGASRIAISKAAITDRFFVLSTGLAGEILQKYGNYHIKIAIYGDFSGYTSKPLQDFIWESNKGSAVFFVPSLEDAVDRLSKARAS